MTISSNTGSRTLADQRDSRTRTQSIQRAALLVRIIAARSRTGVRLTEIASLEEAAKEAMQP